MNPNRWKWYTWTALVLFVLSMIVNYNESLGVWIVTALFCLFVGVSLFVVHILITALFRWLSQPTTNRVDNLPPPPRQNW